MEIEIRESTHGLEDFEMGIVILLSPIWVPISLLLFVLHGAISFLGFLANLALGRY